MQRRGKSIPLVAVVASFAMLALLRTSVGLAQLNPAPAVVPGTSSGTTTSAPVTNLPALSIPAAVPTTAAVAAPGAPAALATQVALPVLNPAPAVVSGNPPLAMQSVFRCSCFGTGLGVQWIGQVQATSYTGANQAAQGQCAAFERATSGVASPFIPQAAGFSFGRTVFPGVNPNLAPGDVVTVPRNPVATEAAASSIIAAETGYCGRCACN
jgi:hypothetical protein